MCFAVIGRVAPIAPYVLRVISFQRAVLVGHVCTSLLDRVLVFSSKWLCFTMDSVTGIKLYGDVQHPWLRSLEQGCVFCRYARANTVTQSKTLWTFY